MTQAIDNIQITIYVIALPKLGGAGSIYRRVGIDEMLRREWVEDCEEISLEIV